MARTIEDGNLIKYGWNSTLEHFGLLVGMAVLTVLPFVGIGILAALILAALGDSEPTVMFILVLLVYIVMIVLAILVNIGWLRVGLAIVDKKQPDFSMLFNGFDAFWRFLGASILYGLIVTVGFFLFIIPGVILMLKYMWMPYLVVDKKMGVMEAMHESDRMTMGLKWDLLGFMMVSYVVAMLGYCAFGIGALLSYPTVFLAMAKLYRSHAK